MSVGRRHHYVPVFILRRFADADGKLYVYDRRIEGITHIPPAAAFVEKHLYSTKERDGSRDRSLEAKLSQLEGDAAPVAEKLIASARDGLVPKLSEEEKLRWDRFVSIQWRRVPDVHQATISEEKFEEMLAEVVVEFEQQVRPATEVEREWLNDPSLRPHFRHNVTVRSLGTKDSMVLEALQSRGLAVAVPERSNTSFIIGSRPVLRMSPPGDHTLLEYEVEAWFAIAPDVAVSPGRERGRIDLVRATQAQVRRVNEHVAAQSTVFASPSEALIRSLLRRRGG